jgi:integrase
MSDMPRKLPPFVNRQRDRHGNLRFYFRRKHGKRIRLPDPQTEGFEKAYAAALAGIPAPRPVKAGIHSLEWLIGQYRQSAAFLALSPATRRQRDNIFRNASMGEAGKQPYSSITKAGIAAARDKRAATPAQARNFLDAVRGLFGWAAESGLVKVDPTVGVKNPPRRKGPGFPAWSDADAARYEAKWPLGTRQRVWYAVLRYTGVRRGDAVTIGWQHVRDGLVTIWTEKSQGRVEVNIPIRRELAEALTAGPTGDLAWICGESGRPLTKESFGNDFRDACNEAGLKKSAHGLRKLAATEGAESGLSVAELEALFGWTGGTMASLYTKTANRKRLAVQASEKIVNATRPHLVSGVGANGENSTKSTVKK